MPKNCVNLRKMIDSIIDLFLDSRWEFLGFEVKLEMNWRNPKVITSGFPQTLVERLHHVSKNVNQIRGQQLHPKVVDLRR